MSKQDEVQDKLDSLINLMSSRSQGAADNDAIERAVSSLLSNVPNVTAPTAITASNASNGSNHNNIIVADQADYDDDDDDEEESAVSKKETNIKQSTTTTANSDGEPIWTGEKATIESLQKQEQELKVMEEKNQLKIPDWKNLEDVPLGRTGARIMITFGDGPVPNHDACTTALLATRQCLQTAIKDARALRRKMKRDYDKARVVVNLHRAKKKERSILGPDAEGAKGVDMDLYFKAIGGHDRRLSYENPSGFDETQLEKLFPEEMYAYQRWNKMHQEYTDSKNDDTTRSTNKLEVEQEQEEMKNEVTLMNDSNVGGHLRDRLAQFDVRTDRMKEQWYIAFSEVRKGSFLDRGGLTSEARSWETERKKGRGRKKMCTWEALPASHIQFLHWVGFDQRSPLPPPDASSTEALAFLAHDFMGKIVEKAIFLKFLNKREEGRANGTLKDDEIVLEMGSHGQLTKKNIEMALSDSTVVPKPLYNASNSALDTIDAAQIYFGPGFEERIEMEMEQ